MDVFEEGQLESIFVEIKGKGAGYIVGVIYRPPNSDIARFSLRMGEILSKIKDKRLYLMGDFNLDLIKSDHHTATGNFLDDINSAGLHPISVDSA